MQLIQQKDEIIAQKDMHIIKLRKNIEQQHSDFVKRLDEKEGHYLNLLSEKEIRILDKEKSIEKLQDRLFELQDKILSLRTGMQIFNPSSFFCKSNLPNLGFVFFRKVVE